MHKVKEDTLKAKLLSIAIPYLRDIQEDPFLKQHGSIVRNRMENNTPLGDIIFELMSLAMAEKEKELIQWCQSWWDEKRRNNDLWRLPADSIGDHFITDLKLRSEAEEGK